MPAEDIWYVASRCTKWVQAGISWEWLIKKDSQADISPDTGISEFSEDAMDSNASGGGIADSAMV